MLSIVSPSDPGEIGAGSARLLMIPNMGDTSVIQEQTRKIFIKHEDITASKNNIEINLQHIWGGIDEYEEIRILFEPNDILVDEEKKYYILCSDIIKIYNDKRAYLGKIGKTGSGPGDFGRCYQLEILSDRTLAVQDVINQRITFFNKDGRYDGDFKLNRSSAPFYVNESDHIVVLNRELTNQESPFWIIHNRKGDIIDKRGNRVADANPYVTNTRYDVAFSLIPKKRLLVAYKYVPKIEVYNSNNVKEIEINYEPGFEVPEISTYKKSGQDFVISEKVCDGIAEDRYGNIYILMLNRARSVEENLAGGRIATMEGITKIKTNIKGDKTDLYSILIIDKDGGIKGNIKLDKYANRLKIYNDSLFLVDTNIQMAIYEYKILYKSREMMNKL